MANKNHIERSENSRLHAISSSLWLAFDPVICFGLLIDELEFWCAFTLRKSRYFFVMGILHLSYFAFQIKVLRSKFEGFLFRRKVARLNRLIERLYLRDERAGISVLNSLDKDAHKLGYFWNGFKWCHKDLEANVVLNYG